MGAFVSNPPGAEPRANAWSERVEKIAGGPYVLARRWYRDYGEWIRKIVLGLAVMFLSYKLFGFWPIFGQELSVLVAVLLGIAAIEKPKLALAGFYLVFAGTLFHGSFFLGAIFAVAFLAFLLPKTVANTELKVALILISPFALHAGWFFFAGVVGGLVYAGSTIAQSTVSASFGFVIAALRGWSVTGLLPGRSALIPKPVTPGTFPIPLHLNHFSHYYLPYLKTLAHEMAPYWVGVVGGVVVMALLPRFVAMLSTKRGLRQDILSTFVPTLVGSGVWALLSNGMRPTFGSGMSIVGINLVGGAGAFLVSQAIPGKVYQVATKSGVSVQNTGSVSAPTTSSTTSSTPTRLRQASWNDIAGYFDVKQELYEAIAPYTDKDARRKLEDQGLPKVGGILLYGPPGVGKTMFGRVLASESKMAFFSVAGSEFFSRWMGESENHLRGIFAEARKAAPAMIFFDEVEAFLPQRDKLTGGDGASQASRQVVATFLAEMDGALDRGDVLVVAATNHPELIDSAAVRAGRFDKVIYIPPPDKAAREHIFKDALAKVSQDDIDIEKLVAMTERYTGSDITSVVTEARRNAVREDRGVTQADLEALFHQTKPTVTFEMLEGYEKVQDKFGRRSHIADRTEVVVHKRLGWDDIGGMDSVKEMFKESIELPLLHPEVFAKWGVQPSRGILLYGPPGVGKTMFAKVVSDTSQSRFYTINGPELLGGGPGEAEKRLRQLFERARENKPAVLFFDEIDAIAASRGSVAGAMQGGVVQQLLTLMDGKDVLDGVVVIAATNRPDQLDSALLRPGRFDRLIYIPLPDAESRVAQWKLRLAERPGGDAIDYEALADASDGYTGAEIAHIANRVVMGGLSASLAGEDGVALDTGVLLAAISSTVRQVTPEMIEAYESLASSITR